MTAASRLRRCSTALAVGRLAALYIVFGLIKHAVPLAVLARFVWRRPRGTRNRSAEVRLVARVIRARHLCREMDRDCLQRSLLLYRELSRVGADPMLIVGFRRAENGLRGHAWVIVDGEALAEEAPASAQFVPTFGFGRGGEILPSPGTRAA